MKRVIEIFGKTDCPNCTKAKAFCEKNSLEFDYGILDEHFTKEELLQEFPTAKSMPQIRVITDDVIENLEAKDVVTSGDIVIVTKGMHKDKSGGTNP